VGLAIGLGLIAVVALLTRKKAHHPTTALPPGATSTTAVPPTGSIPPAPAGLKAVIHGLIDRNGAPPAGYPISAWVIQVNWADLQPQQGGPITANNGIDKAIAQVRAMNSNGGHMTLKLRVYAGIHSPDWAKQLGGPPFPVTDPTAAGGTAPRFWTPQFSQAYAALQTALAKMYDGVPEIREDVISQCTTVFAEPFRRQVPDSGALQAWLSAGYTMAADEACHHAEIDAHNVWQKTTSDLAVNPWLPVVANQGKAGTDLTFPESVMRYCRQRLGVRCGLENNSLKSNPTAPYQQLYQAMKAIGPPMTFQTSQTATVGDVPTAVALGANLGAASIELPVSYKKSPPSQLLSALGPSLSRLQQNPAP